MAATYFFNTVSTISLQPEVVTKLPPTAGRGGRQVGCRGCTSGSVTKILAEREMGVQFCGVMKKLHALFFVFLALASAAADSPYNEAADAKLDIRQALTRAATNNTAIIVVFGANWCGDCQMLHTAMTSGASAPLLSRDFQIVKVDVGHFDKNLDVAKSYGVPLEKGIPAVVIISAKNKVLYLTREGELADARKMGDKAIYEFFKRVAAPFRQPGFVTPGN